MKIFFVFTVILFAACQDNDSKTQQPVSNAYDSIAADDERITIKNTDSNINDSSSKMNEEDEKHTGKKAGTYTGNKNNADETATGKQLNDNDPKGNTNNGDTKSGVYPGNKGSLDDTVAEKQLNNSSLKGNTNNGDTKTGVYPGNKGSLDDTAMETHTPGGNKPGRVKDILHDPKHSMASYPSQKNSLSDTAAEATNLKKKVINRKRQ